MKRLKIVIAYDGRPYKGWQSQPCGNTVQNKIQAAIAEISKFPKVIIHGSGRTDTGVHGLGQVAHFDVDASNSMDTNAWQRALNANLPASIRILSCEEVDTEFHARFSAKEKTYRYEIDTEAVLMPLRSGLAWHVPFPLNIDQLRIAAEHLKGEHDFAAFAANRGDGSQGSTIRTIHNIDIIQSPATLILTFSGNGFLYKMVRLLTGSLVRCALGKEEPEWLAGLLANPTREKSSYSAPADGLYLVRVAYS
jgi:tRNA pseudouridine38-40 synthase